MTFITTFVTTDKFPWYCCHSYYNGDDSNCSSLNLWPLLQVNAAEPVEETNKSSIATTISLITIY